MGGKMKKIFVITLMVATIISLLLAGCASPTTPATPAKPTTPATPAPTPVIELKYGHQNPPTSATAIRYSDAWAKAVEGATNGRVKVTMYPAESLFKSKEAIEATLGGITDVCWASPGFYGKRFSLTLVMAIPFLCLTEGKLNGKIVSSGLINSHILQELFETSPEMQAQWKDFKMINMCGSSATFMGTSKKPIRNLEDMKGLKMREAGGYAIEMWKLMGASPVAMNMPEVYDALSKGVIDGTNNPWSTYNTFKLSEVIKYYSTAPIQSTPMIQFMNLKKWNSLPPDIQKAIESVSGMKAAEAYGDAAWGDNIKQEVLDVAKKGGNTVTMVDLEPGVYEKWKEIGGKPIWDKWVAEMKADGLNGQKVLDAAIALVKKYSP